jgi:prepilin-type processing-associated H-X9-DG protein
MQNAVVTPGSIGSPLPKTGSDSIFICPSMTGVVAASQDTSGSVSVRNGYFYIYGGTSGSNGKANSTRPVCFSYGINSKLDNTLPVQKLSQFNDPSSTALIVERRMAPGEVPLGDPYYSVCYPKNLGQLKGDMGRMSTRHNGGANIGFVDGHVAWFSFDELNAPYETKPTVNYNYPGKIVWDPFGPVTSD